MRDQYAGDVSDLLKLAFLRTLAGEDRTIGVGWYYNPANDGRRDGCHREYCAEPKWEALDAAIWNALKKLPERSVAALEKLRIWPAKTCFHRDAVPSTGTRWVWTENMRSKLKDACVVFLDPDNGIGPASERHATIEEVAAMRQPGRAVVLIKFPGRHQKHAQQVEEYHRILRQMAHADSVVTVWTCVWLKQPRSRWFTIIDGDNDLTERARRFAHTLNGIEKCSAGVIPWSEPMDQSRKGVPMAPERVRPNAATAERTGKAGKVCPECGHRFKGNGFDGIDAHWRAKHEDIKPYKEAWPLVKAGSYSANALRRDPAAE